MSNTISDVVALNGTKGGSTELGKGRRGFRCVKNVEYNILIGGPNNTMPSIYVVVLGHIGHMTSSHLESPENADIIPTIWIKPGGLREVKWLACGHGYGAAESRDEASRLLRFLNRGTALVPPCLCIAVKEQHFLISRQESHGICLFLVFLSVLMNFFKSFFHRFILLHISSTPPIT